MRSTLAGLLALTVCTAALPADAFLLVGKSKKVAHAATRVIALREGARTVLSVQPEYVGPAGEVALIVPVGAGAGEPPSTLSPSWLERVASVSQPRFAELWEQDPCEVHLDQVDVDAPPAAAPPQVDAAAPASSWKLQPLEGKSGADVASALERAGYDVPKGAAEAMELHLGAGGRFVLASFDAPEGAAPTPAWLPPLRVEYDEKDLRVDARLAALRGAHDLTLYVLSPEGRYEPASGPNQAIPTNLDVTPKAKAEPGVFFDRLVGHVFSAKPDATVTEYAWRATSCDGCAAPLGEVDLLAMGVRRLPSVAKQHEVLVELTGVDSRPDGPDVVRRRLGDCYGRWLESQPARGGQVALEVRTGAGGEVTSATPTSGEEGLKSCAKGAFEGQTLDAKNASGQATVTFAPLARDVLGAYVLTRLHTRFAKAAGREVVLRRGAPLEGGREEGPQAGEAAPARVYASDAGDDFQARYVVRHPWAGKVECATPKRNVWSETPVASAEPAPTAGASPGPAASASAKAPRNAGGGEPGPTDFAAWLASGKAPDLAPFVIDLPAATSKPAAPAAPSAGPAPSLAPPPAPRSSAAPSPPPTSSGCGCEVPPARSTSRLGWAAIALAALGVRRARRRR